VLLGRGILELFWQVFIYICYIWTYISIIYEIKFWHYWRLNSRPCIFYLFLLIYLWWYWDLNFMFARQAFYHLSHSTSPVFVLGIFERVSWTICWGCLWNTIFLILASQVARITGMSHWHLAYIVFIYIFILGFEPRGLTLSYTPLALIWQYSKRNFANVYQ
jgi:hypothetical protein